MKAQPLQYIARMIRPFGGSYAEYSPRTDFGGSVIIKHKDIIKTYIKQLGNPGVLDDNVSQKLDEAFQKVESGTILPVLDEQHIKALAAPHM